MPSPFRIKIAFAVIARSHFDVAFAKEKADAAWSVVSKLDAEIAGSTQLLMTRDDVAKVAPSLVAASPDLLVIFHATFADSSVAVALAKAVDAPILQWSVPEPRTGGRLRLNSLCGANLAGHTLQRNGFGYDHVTREPSDPSVAAEIDAAARAGYVKRRLATAKVGIIGRFPDGYEPCSYDAETVRRMCGTVMEQMEISEFIARAKTVDRSATDAPYETLRSRLQGLDALDAEAARGTLKAYVAMKEIIRERGYDAVAVRCWPEFFTEMGCAACAAVSMLNDERTVAACEADAYGALTNMMLLWMSGQPVFLTDLVDIDRNDDTGVLWHCGAAPLAMADPESPIRASVHPNRKLPLINDFAMKPGRITIARLTQAANETRLVIGGGEFIRRPNSYSGTSGVVRFDSPAEKVWQNVMDLGLEHHVCFAYGDYRASLKKLAAMLEIPTVDLC